MLSIQLGTVCRFTFKDGCWFSVLNPIAFDESTPNTDAYINDTAGFYKILSYTNLFEIQRNGIDLKTMLSTLISESPTGGSLDADEEYTKFTTWYTDSDILVLQDVHDEETIWYVPEDLLAEFPKVNLKQYSKVIIGTDVGIVNDPTELGAISKLISDILLVRYGIQASVKIGTYDNVYLTDDQYGKLADQRTAIKGNPTNDSAYAIAEDADMFKGNVWVTIDKLTKQVAELQQFQNSVTDAIVA